MHKINNSKMINLINLMNFIRRTKNTFHKIMQNCFFAVNARFDKKNSGFLYIFYFFPVKGIFSWVISIYEAY